MKLVAAGVALAVALVLAGRPVESLFAAWPSLRDEATLAALILLSGVVYCGTIGALFGREWLAAFRRRRAAAPSMPVSE
jgi:hypothetical protein